MAREIKIDKNVPIPPKHQYKFRELEVGDSFFVPGGDIKHLWSLASSAQRTNGFKFRMKTLRENGEQGVRVWRIED